MKEINRELFKEWFHYDETSPSGLRWARDCLSGINHHIKVKNKGDVAGRKVFRRGGKPFRWELTFKNKKYALHRILWTIVVGEIPEKLVIDHLDRNPFNNNVSNLAVKTNRDNQRNISLSSANKTGVTGVSYKSTNGYEYFVASWVGLDDKYKRKGFSISKLGRDVAFQQACQFRKEMIAFLVDNGNNYTKTHGE